MYALVFKLKHGFKGRVGSLGEVVLEPGIYVYIGSARGGGGLRARILRHISRSKRIHWHIDYVTMSKGYEPLLAVYTKTEDDVEEEIARNLISYNAFSIACQRFGSTDKNSPSHLLKCIDEFNKCIEIIVEIFKQYGTPEVAKLDCIEND